VCWPTDQIVASFGRIVPIVVACDLLACVSPRTAAPTPTTRSWADSGARGPEAELYRTWVRYLESKRGQYSGAAGRPSPYWLRAEQQHWRVYDLAASYLPNFATPDVLSIQRDPDLEGEYRVVTRFHSNNENNAMRSRDVRMTV